MYWVYILKCQNEIFYVGQTSRLFRRFWEHESGKGGVNTEIYKPIEVVAVYKINVLGNFFNYNYYIHNCSDDTYFYKYFNGLKFLNKCNNGLTFNKLRIENNIAECMMINVDNWEKIRGGRYIRFDTKYKRPINKYLESLPLCNCNLPCDIKYSKKKQFLYFRCPKKNIWDNVPMSSEIKPCNFFQEYTIDKKFRTILFARRKQYKKKIRKLFKNGRKWLDHIPELKGGICVGGCQQKLYNNICYSYENKRLCWNCFKNNHDALEEEFNVFKTYMIDDSYE